MTAPRHAPHADFHARLAATRRMLRDRETGGAIIMGPEAQYWLCGLDTFLGALIPLALIFATDGGEPVLVVWDADAPLARHTSVLADVRTFRFGVDDPAALFAQLAASAAPSPARIGIDLSSRAIPFAFGNALSRALDGRDLVDITLDLAKLRAVKSPAEIALMRIAGSYGRRGLEAARRYAQPGTTELGLAAEVEYAMRRAGSDYCSILTEMTSGPRSLFGHGTPADRVPEPGDLMHLEIGGVKQRYNCVAMQTLVVPGAGPKPAARELYDVALRCLRAGLRQLRPGVPAAEVEEPALGIIRQAGLGEVFKMRFGYGVGIGYQPSWLEPLQITRTSTDILDVGTTFVLHACLLDERESIGVLVGATYVITGDGYEMLSGAGDVELT
jgi:Xaa-Pro dipeptidase